jgi:hypothetical protein
MRPTKKRRANHKSRLKHLARVFPIGTAEREFGVFRAVAATRPCSQIVVQETKTLAILGMIYSRRRARSRMRHVGFLAGRSLE